MGKTYCHLAHAAETLAIPVEYLESKCRLSRLLYFSPEAPTAPLVVLLDAAKSLGVPRAIAEQVEQGREWLMTAANIRQVYGHDEATRDKISGGPQYETVHGKVYQVSPFIQWLGLDPREQRQRLEGKKSNGKIQNKRVR